MLKSTNNRKSAPSPEKTSTLTVPEILILFIAFFAIITGNMLLLLADLVFMAFVLAGSRPSTFKASLNILTNLLKTKWKL